MANTTTNQLHRVDLNLLVALDILLKELNVTNAAQAMFVSQSAMSRSLKRLRDTFDDPLFVRTATGLTPTAKALELGEELQDILPKLSALFQKDSFNPLQCNYTFTLALPSFLGSTMLPSLALELFSEAPDVNLVEMSAKTNPYDLLDKGKLDFAIYYSHSSELKYRTTKIASIYPVLFVRREHPLVNSQASLNEIMQYPVLAMNIEEDHKQAFNTPLQRIFASLQSEKRPKLRSTQTQVLIDIAAKSDAVIFGLNALSTMPGFVDDFMAIYDFKDQPQYHVELYLIQQQRTFNSVAHQWLANKISASAKLYL
jgi:DNA-binding transcriptional LysR family regulator